MNSPFDLMLSSALDEVAGALAKHKQGAPAPLSSALFAQVQKELENMQQVMYPAAFKPGYPRFLLDWPDETGLVERLSELAYSYGKLKGNRCV